MTIQLPFLAAAPFPRLRLPLLLFAVAVRAGFPSPADDHLEGQFDLNELCVAIYREGYRYKKAGVLCLDLVPDGKSRPACSGR